MSLPGVSAGSRRGRGCQVFGDPCQKNIGATALTSWSRIACPPQGPRCVCGLSFADPPRTVPFREHDDAVTDEQPADVCLFDRLLVASLSLERVEHHLGTGRVYVDGELVTDPYRLAPPPARIVIHVA